MIAAPCPRLPGWEARLADLIEARRHRPFAWGQADCLTLARDAGRAITGADPFTPLNYRTQRGAIRVGRRAGFPCLRAFMAAHLPEAQRARRGDLVLMPLAIQIPGAAPRRRGRPGWQWALGVCLGRMAACAGPDGLIFLPTEGRAAAFHLGD
jgi:hypothetical protein